MQTTSEDEYWKIIFWSQIGPEFGEPGGTPQPCKNSERYAAGSPRNSEILAVVDLFLSDSTLTSGNCRNYPRYWKLVTERIRKRLLAVYLLSGKISCSITNQRILVLWLWHKWGHIPEDPIYILTGILYTLPRGKRVVLRNQRLSFQHKYMSDLLNYFTEKQEKELRLLAQDQDEWQNRVKAVYRHHPSGWETTDRREMLKFSTLFFFHDQLPISPCHMTSLKHIQVMRIDEMITKDKVFCDLYSR